MTILETMLSRLQQALLKGPSLNARPHNSRQRVDWTNFSQLGTIAETNQIDDLIAGPGKLDIPANYPPFKKPEYPEEEWSDEQKEASKLWSRQNKLLTKLAGITADAQDYYNDHGEPALFVAYPILSLPPSKSDSSLQSGRVLAPLGFIPVDLAVRRAAKKGVAIKSTGEGADLVIPNPALLTFLEQQTGEDSDELFSDEEGSDPWREINEIAAYAAKATDCDPVKLTSTLPLVPIPKAGDLPEEPMILNSAVVGLFPIRNPGLIRDTKWMMEHEKSLVGPIQSFLTQKTLASAEESFLPEAESLSVDQQTAGARDFNEEYFITHADPCQSTAVKLSHEAQALVIHGPPGTGKSQTIVNIIGNFLARGERVLFVCDKRTALDVVKYRLDALGLGHLSGVIHDPQRDRKNFYMGLREILENLAESRPDTASKHKLSEVNDRLNALHQELRESYALLHGENERGESYHSLVGKWLEARELGGIILATLQEEVDGWSFSPSEIETHQTDIVEVLQRSREAKMETNPWPGHCALDLATWLDTTPSSLDADFSRCENIQHEIDKFDSLEEIPLSNTHPLSSQAAAFENVAELLGEIDAESEEMAKNLWHRKTALFKDFCENWNALRPSVEQMEAPFDRTLYASLGGVLPPVAELNTRLQSLIEWKAASKKWTKFLASKKKKAAIAAQTPLGLPTDSEESLNSGIEFYSCMRARTLVAGFLDELTTTPSIGSSQLTDCAKQVTKILRVRELLEKFCPNETDVILGRATESPNEKKRLAKLCVQNSSRAKAIEKLEEAIAESKLLNADARSEIIEAVIAGKSASAILTPYRSHLPKLESLLRLQANLEALPYSLQVACETLIPYTAYHEDEAIIATLQASATRRVLSEFLKDNPELAHIDTTRIDAAFDELNNRLQEKQELTQRVISDYWMEVQRFRLLASTGSRLNSLGASVRQRLLVRGKRALKLRQMVAAGTEVEGGDPLFDLCPVWMASADTVAQIFPKKPLFDAVIFDEASQCRLEEAFPVFLRAKRIVIAGDPKQLPPTRFFESAVIESDQQAAETADELHQQQMSDTEDLLTGALNLDVHEAFLDVHYRSRNEALIGFSNEYFYQSRLQPIPGHPKNKAVSPPLRIKNVRGLYKDQTNLDEANEIVDLVAELLSEPEPPSIGIASFNLKQRTLITDRLEAQAAEDRIFAERLEIARKRRGKDSFEGLFVKNLENVQGDERDHIVISTTFGRDEEGKFRRNFGALSRVGGERRLNVLVTRARSAIHIFTSIPREEYSSGAMPGTGERITGRHLLYAYLRYAEAMDSQFDAYQDHLESLRMTSESESIVRETESPSSAAMALGALFASTHKTGNEVHWGNDGFCIDVALQHPYLPEDVTVGVLTDFNRFRKTPDPIDWERFRSLVFRSQGWDLVRLWSPRLLRDPDGELEQIMMRHRHLVENKNSEQISTEDG